MRDLNIQVRIPLPPFKRQKPRVKKPVTPPLSPLRLELPYCFESDVNTKQAIKFYCPSLGLVDSPIKQSSLLSSWHAVKDHVTTADTPVEEIVRPRKSTESVLDLLDNRSSFDFILTTSSETSGTVMRRDVSVVDSQDTSTSASEAEDD